MTRDILKVVFACTRNHCRSRTTFTYFSGESRNYLCRKLCLFPANMCISQRGYFMVNTDTLCAWILSLLYLTRNLFRVRSTCVPVLEPEIKLLFGNFFPRKCSCYIQTVCAHMPLFYFFFSTYLILNYYIYTAFQIRDLQP